MNDARDKLYELLPAVHRLRDAREGEPLRALLQVIGRQLEVLEEDLAQLYDDQFIETCTPWVLPYIGDLIGHQPLHPIRPRQVTPRAEVANTIGYRRRKGTATVLEQLARDVTGWNARAVEFFQLLATTQIMNHVRLTNHYAPDLRNWEPLERLGTGFESSARTIDVRHVARGEGKYNIPNIGIYLWRLDAFRLRRSPAVGLDDHRFLFHPLGVNTQLFTRPQPEPSITHLADPINVPEPISRRVLDAAIASYYGADLSLFIEGVPLADIAVCNLANTDAGGTTWAHTPPTAEVAIDPVLGRIAFRTPRAEAPLVVFHFGFSAPMGGGEYERSASFSTELTPIDLVDSSVPLQPALNARAGGGVVQVTDSGRFEATPSFALAAGARVEVRAADERRPALIASGPIDISGGAEAELTLNGLLIAGGPLRIVSSAANKLRKLRLVHCTLVPGLSLDVDGTPASAGSASLLIEQADEPIEVEIDHCIIGALRAPPQTRVRIRHSIVDANSEEAFAYADLDGAAPGGTLSIINSTVIGRIQTRLLKLASNSIFLAQTPDGSAPIRSERRQTGCVRFSWMPLSARVPRRYRCQPDLEIANRIEKAQRVKGIVPVTDAERQQIRKAVLARLVPAFTSLRYGDPGYCQLRIAAPKQIRAGTDDEAEMGAFHDLFQPQRESNVRTRLDEYLRFGLEAGVFYQT